MLIFFTILRIITNYFLKLVGAPLITLAAIPFSAHSHKYLHSHEQQKMCP